MEEIKFAPGRYLRQKASAAILKLFSNAFCDFILKVQIIFPPFSNFRTLTKLNSVQTAQIEPERTRRISGQGFLANKDTRLGR